jgi:hypothetical protein
VLGALAECLQVVRLALALVLVAAARFDGTAIRAQRWVLARRGGLEGGGS